MDIGNNIQLVIDAIQKFIGIGGADVIITLILAGTMGMTVLLPGNQPPSNTDNAHPLIHAFQNLSAIGNSDIIIMLILAGTVSMAVLQLLKELSPIRTWFQQRWIARWVSVKVPSGSQDERETACREAEQELVALATGGDTDAFYSLPADQLVAQMNAAVQLVLDYPETYRSLFMVLANGAADDDIKTVLTKSVPGELDTGEQQYYLHARNRVGHRIQRNLDAVQISMSNRWKLWLQYVCLFLSVILIEGGVFSLPEFSAGTVLLGLVIGVLGGYLGPVVRDFVAALQKLRY